MDDIGVVEGQGRALTATEFSKLADVPPELEWFANLRNPNTRLAYQQDLAEFQRFVGIGKPEEFRSVTRAHVIAWRSDLERRRCAPTTIQRKLAAVSSLFAYLCEQNAVLHNPVDGVVTRPKSNRQRASRSRGVADSFGLKNEGEELCGFSRHLVPSLPAPLTLSPTSFTA